MLPRVESADDGGATIPTPRSADHLSESYFRTGQGGTYWFEL